MKRGLGISRVTSSLSLRPGLIALMQLALCGPAVAVVYRTDQPPVIFTGMHRLGDIGWGGSATLIGLFVVAAASPIVPRLTSSRALRVVAHVASALAAVAALLLELLLVTFSIWPAVLSLTAVGYLAFFIGALVPLHALACIADRSVGR